ncbi:hypothetical protein HMPREF9333_00713 [Johnsonella ignava ATCC 51276]|uniref:DUF4364 domain-containing protein n=1 Tax=Johnsonella ignava ATCC 51276 TaxID=679200 RepID=G5GGM3_9FIRM|nr:DUF4364 family protein [Johnsonella ignava]EHI56183.1 hypothetical protein HMPREF9333_00713 [Johnsonella ignava ATCC 51276]
MLSETETLYKLIILYMLHHVTFPLSTSQLLDFFVNRHQYTDFFTLQKVISELEETELITQNTTSHNASFYVITNSGEETLEYFGKRIPGAILEDANEFLKENKVKLRDESNITANFYKSTAPGFIAHCEVREGKDILISMDLSVPDAKSAELICGNWKNASNDIYQYVVKKLFDKE